MKDVIFKSIKYTDYKNLQNYPVEIIYYINNVVNKNIFFKAGNRYNSATAIYRDAEVPKYGDIGFKLNHFYFNVKTGKVFIYKDINELIVYQNSWEDSAYDETVINVSNDTLRLYHNNNIPDNSGCDSKPSSDTFGIYVVSELPKFDIKNGIYCIYKNTPEDSDIYDEYIYVNKKWELIGSFHNNSGEDNKYVTFERLTEILLSYYTKDQSNFRYYTKAEVNQIANYILSKIDGTIGPELPEQPQPDLSLYLKIEDFIKEMKKYYTRVEIDNMFNKVVTIDDLNDLYIRIKDELNKEIDNIKTNLTKNYYNKKEIDAIIQMIDPDGEIPDLSEFITRSEFNNLLERLKDIEDNMLSKEFFNKEITKLINKFNDYVLKSDFDEFKNSIESSQPEEVPQGEIKDYYNNKKDIFYANLIGGNI